MKVKDRAKSGASKRAGRGRARKEGNQKRNPRTRISALFRKRTYKQSLVTSVVQATLYQGGHKKDMQEGRRARGRPKTTWRRTVEKQRNKAEWKSPGEELGSSQSGYMRMVMMMMMMMRRTGTHGKGQRKNTVVCTRVEKLSWQAISTQSSSAHVEERDQEYSQTRIKHWGGEWLLLQF